MFLDLYKPFCLIKDKPNSIKSRITKVNLALVVVIKIKGLGGTCQLISLVGSIRSLNTTYPFVNSKIHDQQNQGVEKINGSSTPFL